MWPWEWLMRAIFPPLISSTFPRMASINFAFSTGGSIGISLCGYTGELVSSPTTVSAHSLNFGIFCPENWYLLPEICTLPSSFIMNSVSLYPQPFTLNHCSLFRIESSPFISYFLSTVVRLSNLLILVRILI